MQTIPATAGRGGNSQSPKGLPGFAGPALTSRVHRKNTPGSQPAAGLSCPLSLCPLTIRNKLGHVGFKS